MTERGISGVVVAAALVALLAVGCGVVRPAFPYRAPARARIAKFGRKLFAQTPSGTPVLIRR
jgi:hypothetical protein